jgi:hypothetical protein
MTYRQGTTSYLNEYDFTSFTAESFYKSGQAKSFHEMLLSQIPSLSFIPGVVEDNFTTDGINTNESNTECLLNNITTYINACGKERIAEDILDTCNECVYGPMWFNVIQIYDKATLEVIQNFFNQIYAKHITLKILSPEQELLDRVAEKLNFDLANKAATHTIPVTALIKDESNQESFKSFTKLRNLLTALGQDTIPEYEHTETTKPEMFRAAA